MDNFKKTSSETAEEKIRKYRTYINSRQYYEEQAAYQVRLQLFRDRLMNYTKDALDT